MSVVIAVSDMSVVSAVSDMSVVSAVSAVSYKREIRGNESTTSSITCNMCGEWV